LDHASGRGSSIVREDDDKIGRTAWTSDLYAQPSGCLAQTVKDRLRNVCPQVDRAGTNRPPPASQTSARRRRSNAVNEFASRVAISVALDDDLREHGRRLFLLRRREDEGRQQTEKSAHLNDLLPMPTNLPRSAFSRAACDALLTSYQAPEGMPPPSAHRCPGLLRMIFANWSLTFAKTACLSAKNPAGPSSEEHAA
jgi:hypothetical protein